MQIVELEAWALLKLDIDEDELDATGALLIGASFELPRLVVIGGLSLGTEFSGASIAFTPGWFVLVLLLELIELLVILAFVPLRALTDITGVVVTLATLDCCETGCADIWLLIGTGMSCTLMLLNLRASACSMLLIAICET
jgi:hypothetical protein